MADKLLKYDVAMKSTKTVWQMETPRCYTGDENTVTFDFNITDLEAADLIGVIPNVYLYMRDGSFFQNGPADGVEITGTTVNYTMKGNEGKHSGIAKAQLVLVWDDGINPAEKLTSQLYVFEVVSGLENKVAVEVMIQDWTTLTREARTFIDTSADEVDALKDELQTAINTANASLGEFDIALQNGIVATNIAAELQNLEETYAPDMVSVKEQLAHLDDTKADLADLPSSAYVFKGSTTFALLPTTGNTLGDVYFATDVVNNYAWTGTTWTPIGNGAFADGSVVTKKIADKNVTPIKASFFDHKPNLWTFGDRTVTGTGSWNHTEHHISVPEGNYTLYIESAEGYVSGITFFAEVFVELENTETKLKTYAIPLNNNGAYVENIVVPSGYRIHVNLFLSHATPPPQSQTATFKGISLINGSYAELITPNLKMEYLDVPKILEPTFDVVGSSALVSTSEVVTATNPAAYACRTVTVDVLSDTSYLLDIESVVGSQTTTILGIELLDVNNARISLNFYTTLETPFTTTTLTKKVKFYFYLTYSTGATGTFTATFTNIMLHKLGVLSKLYRVNYDNLSAEIKGLVPIKVVPEIFLPKHFYVALGYPIEIYNNTIIRGGIDKEYIFDWKITSGGKNTGRKLVLTNTEALSGTTSTLTLDVYDNGFNKIGTVTSTIHWVKAVTSQNPVSVKKLLYIGDSLTDISTWRTQLYDRSLANVGSNFENVGTLGTAPYLHEGHSGWSINSYLTNAAEGWNGDYKVAVAVDPNITPKKQYRFGTKIFEYEKTETEEGTIWVYFNRVSGAGFVTTADSPATGVDGAVVGDTPITFTSVAITSLNPFYNATSGTFDINKYSTDYLSGAMPDYTFIWLGTNGATGSMDVATSKANVLAEVAKLKTIVDNLSTVSGMKIFIAYNHLRANQTGLGYSAGTTQLTAAYDMYVLNLNKAIYDTFSTYANVILVPVGQTFDRENNYPTRNTQVNQYNTATIIEQTDSVHPVQSTGFMQFADTFYATVIGNI